MVGFSGMLDLLSGRRRLFHTSPEGAQNSDDFSGTQQHVMVVLYVFGETREKVTWFCKVARNEGPTSDSEDGKHDCGQVRPMMPPEEDGRKHSGQSNRRWY